MGSTDFEAPTGEDEITVYVTGFGPFRAQYPVNPAWEIARSLPPFLPPPAHATELSTLAASPPVRILVHPEPVKVTYERVRAIVPSLWEEGAGGRRIDYMVHIGMATGRGCYCVERRGHRDGYDMRDVDDKFLNDGERRKLEGDDWIWAGMPEEILTDVDVDDVWRRWRTALPAVDVRPSEDAGHYLCDFIYYSSLAYLTKKNEDKRVVFLHVPVQADPMSVRRGTEVAIELIRALVQSGRMKKITSTR
ncbi:pyroglutamyl peptidase [Phlyctema vagabunda]|uniref:Pyroglutamyl peptidase n=1 Tax=Phlyctema vagabunda TaxID=108571 RepID=A0ABR4P6Y9_9HELO